MIRALQASAGNLAVNRLIRGPTNCNSGHTPIQRRLDGSKLNRLALKGGTESSTVLLNLTSAIDTYNTFIESTVIAPGETQLQFKFAARLRLVPVAQLLTTLIQGSTFSSPAQTFTDEQLRPETARIDALSLADDPHWLTMVGKTYSLAMKDESKWGELRQEGYTEDRIFADFIPNPIPEQGWKLHVTADDVSAPRVAATILPLLRQLKINHKVVATASDYLTMTGSQAGKFITIYPADSDTAKKLVIALNHFLSKAGGLTGPTPPGEKVVGSSGLVSTRWGAFTSEYVFAPFDAPLEHGKAYLGAITELGTGRLKRLVTCCGR